jgi:uncharacterized membrane protein (DUF4010 family)
MELTEPLAALRLLIAALIGLAVGLERQWSGHAAGPQARFGGIRTFLLLGLVGGIGGLLLARNFVNAGGLVLGGGIAFGVAAYIMAVRRPEVSLDATTEAAAMVVVALSALAGAGWITLAAATGSVVVLALREKTRLHELVARLGESTLRAALQFAVLALVILPLLPSGSVGALGLRPRALWSVVLLFSALNFAAYLARRVVGPERGYAITGALGGFISSTLVTINYSRLSRADREAASPLAAGVIAACTVLIPRVFLLSSVLSPDVARALIPLLIPPLVAGVVAIVVLWRSGAQSGAFTGEEPRNPLRLFAAIQMALVFQAAIIILDAIRQQFGAFGLYASGAFLGITSLDALTYSMTRGNVAVSATDAARVIAVGVLAATLVKIGIALVVGAPRYRVRIAAGLGFTALASVGGLLMAR